MLKVDALKLESEPLAIPISTSAPPPFSQKTNSKSCEPAVRLTDRKKRTAADDEFVFSARLEIDMINEKFRIGLPDKEEYETLGGMIINFAETIPEKGDEFNIENFNIKILEVEETKIIKVQLKLLQQD